MKPHDLDIDKTLYQVWLLKSPVPFPFSFAMHGWFVVNIKGDLNRWEFGQFGNPLGPKKIGVFKNLLPLTAGMNKYGWKTEPRSKATLLFSISGGEDSLAREIATFISRDSENYPFKKTYRYLGPNSNTYLQWVLNHFVEIRDKLPNKAIGKNYLGLKN
jgi:hypothetical protein